MGDMSNMKINSNLKIIILTMITIFILVIIFFGIQIFKDNQIKQINEKIYNGEEITQEVNNSFLSDDEKKLFNDAISRKKEKLLNGKNISKIILEEKERQKLESEIAEKEKKYKENLNYSYYYDEEAQVGFYYNKQLKITDSKSSQFRATSGTGFYSTSFSYEFKKMNTKDIDFESYVVDLFKDIEKTIQDITISEITPVKAKKVKITDPKQMDMTFYYFYNENGVIKLCITNLLNPSIPKQISEILDTFIITE
jgi:hypothetical protein